jgi:hypothetical protein
VDDFRRYYVNTTNSRSARYYCVRLTHNGQHVKQFCDPTDEPIEGNGVMTGVVRAAVEQLWGELRRGRFLDTRSRLMTITLQLKSNNAGIRYRLLLMFELTSLGTVLPSYHVQTRLLQGQMLNDMVFYSRISLYTVIMFVTLEILRIIRAWVSHGGEGLYDYATDMWNVLDWANFAMYGLVWVKVVQIGDLLLRAEDDCESYFCREVGYRDDWLLMNEFEACKQLLSFNLWIQLLKVAKYTSAMVPKMSLATDTLRKCLVDVLFFGVVVVNTIIAFSTTLWIQLGPQMVGFYDQVPAAITLFRGLFSDFDMDGVMYNSSGYFNSILMLAYLFVAVFIMLSLFLAILAEAQAAARDKEAAHKADPK